MLMIHMYAEKNIRDMFFEDLNSYHQNIKLAVEINPSKILDTEITN